MESESRKKCDLVGDSEVSVREEELQRSVARVFRRFMLLGVVLSVPLASAPLSIPLFGRVVVCIWILALICWLVAPLRGNLKGKPEQDLQTGSVFVEWVVPFFLTFVFAAWLRWSF